MQGKAYSNFYNGRCISSLNMTIGQHFNTIKPPSSAGIKNIS